MEKVSRVLTMALYICYNFGVDNSSLSHADNRKNNFLISGDGPTFRINGNSGSPEKKI